MFVQLKHNVENFSFDNGDLFGELILYSILLCINNYYYAIFKIPNMVLTLSHDYIDLKFLIPCQYFYLGFLLLYYGI